MKAIETVYNGYRFRSRLEARWAVFFDSLGFEYQYEPEGFELGDGARYLPDFWIWNCWVEIKPQACTNISILEIFSGLHNKNVVLLSGEPYYGSYKAYVYYKGIKTFSGTISFYYSDDFTGIMIWNDFNNSFFPLDAYPETIKFDLHKAYTAARQARFEHGEKGFRDGSFLQMPNL